MSFFKEITRYTVKPQYRSRRERVGLWLFSAVMLALGFLPARFAIAGLIPGVSIAMGVLWFLGVTLIGLVGFDAWCRWGRSRFPLHSTAEGR